MDEIEATMGRTVVMQPPEGLSFWQPRPANGYSQVKLRPEETGFAALSMGYQTVAPGGRVRAHSHDAQVEIQICFRGMGSVVADGVRHPLVPGTMCFVGRDVRHEIVNDGEGDLVLIWAISPPGLEISSPQSAGRAARASPRRRPSIARPRWPPSSAPPGWRCRNRLADDGDGPQSRSSGRGSPAPGCRSRPAPAR